MTDLGLPQYPIKILIQKKEVSVKKPLFVIRAGFKPATF